MFGQPRGSGQPPPLPPDDGDGRGGDLDNRNIHRSIPINNDPGTVTGSEAVDTDDASSMPSSFALLSALRQRNLRTWPRQRRRDSKSPRPPSKTQPQGQSQQQEPISSSASTSTLQQHTPDSSQSRAAQHIQSPLVSLLAMPPAGSAFLHHRSQATKQPKQSHQRRRMPYPLNANAQERSPSHSPPLLFSPSASAPSVAETPREVEQLTGDFSRHHLEHTKTARPCSTSGSIKTSVSGSGRGSGIGSGGSEGSELCSGPGNRSESRYGDALANFSPGMAEFRLRRGGNEPVIDLEVDMDQDNRNDDGDCVIRPPSPSPLESASQRGPSSYAPSVDIDAAPVVPPGLQRMRMRQTALADASVRHLNLDLKPFPRQTDPETDVSQEPEPETVPPAEAAPPTATLAAAQAEQTAPALVPAGTGAAALAAASSIELGDDNLAPLPLESMAMLAPYPQHSFHPHPQPYARSYYSQSLSYSHSLPQSRPHSRQPSISASTQSDIPPQHSLPLSREALTMPHLAPLHNDVPSSGYDMKGWLSSSSMVEASTSLITGTIDNHSETIAIDMVAHKTEADSSVVRSPHAMDTRVEDATSNNDQRSDYPSTEASSARETTRTSERLQPRKQFYTAYLQPHQLSFLHSSDGPNPPMDTLEADMDKPNTESITDRVSTIPEEAEGVQTPVSGSASGSATLSHATNQDSAKTTTPSGQYMLPSQRVRLIQMAMAREAERVRSENSADGSSTNGSNVIVPTDDRMDVEMADPIAIEAQAPSLGLSSNINSSLIGSLPPLWDPDQPESLHKYIGPFRYRLSSEVAMRCTNLVHNKPRMRRRRPPGDGSVATNDSSSSLRGGSHKDGSGLQSDQRSERPQKQSVPLEKPSPPPEPLVPPVPDPALMQIEQPQLQQPEQLQQPTQQYLLPVWAPSAPESIDVPTDMS
ncbi:hypothetical protein HMPREF1624_00531 [Sporothrix schenckii ATCC 58251]|uniref:Uncharacterized protein n=1 Tax=Sporothrix schenckii (strain ATCC 58251 / de Perez 2211183) TaxID=1391915 RepID=U7Q2Z3_SPOS1|nr:hypothetical protein HMPREF1624_00531 [Sporothrix schenckii ATCC 58251]